MQSESFIDAQAAVLRTVGGSFTIETVQVDAPGPDEALIRIAGVGLCHTDIAVLQGAIPFPLPGVLGHEGSGIVEQVGANVTHVQPGDSVVLSFRTCGTCTSCSDFAPAYCENFWLLNFTGARPDGTPSILQAGEAVGGSFFGQSSFATHALASASNIVRVDADLPLALLGPLGCGVQTGAGAVMRSLACRAGSSILIVGAGGVGLSAVMGAALQGCDQIFVYEPHAERRALALELGATHALDPADGALADIVAGILPAGVEYALDTTAIPELVRAAFGALAKRGVLGLLGAPKRHDETFVTHMGDMVGGGRMVRGIMEGDSDPAIFIPELIAHYKAGRFPFDRLIKTYKMSEINEAIADQHAGRCIKPVLLPEQPN